MIPVGALRCVLSNNQWYNVTKILVGINVSTNAPSGFHNTVASVPHDQIFRLLSIICCYFFS